MAVLHASLPEFEKALREALGRIAKTLATQTAIAVMQGVADNTPVEDGHAHEAWYQAAAQTDLGIAQKINWPQRSGDTAAMTAGYGACESDENGTTILMENGLDFIQIIENGGTIYPSEPGGRKASPVERPPAGPLYGPRTNEGWGMVAWKDAGGKTHFASHYTIPASDERPVGRAIDEVKAQLEQLNGRKSSTP